MTEMGKFDVPMLSSKIANFSISKAAKVDELLNYSRNIDFPAR